MAKLISFFGSRVEDTIKSWPSSTKEAVRHYLHFQDGKKDFTRTLDSRAVDQPYWILLPFWLVERFTRNNAHRFSARFMNDIIWAQYCLFVFIRMQDDLFDGHTHSLPLLYAADGFLLEAERIFLKYFPKNSPFWEIYISSIEGTIFAVASADDLESGSRRSNKKLLSHYGDTAAICNIAAAAVCLKAGKKYSIPRIASFSNEMMKAGAIVDDLRDMQEDMQRGRFNSAVSYFLPRYRMKASLMKKNIRLITKNIRDHRRVSRLFRTIRRHVNLAERVFSPLVVPAAREYLRSDRRTLKRMEEFMHWQKTNKILRS